MATRPHIFLVWLQLSTHSPLLEFSSSSVCWLVTFSPSNVLDAHHPYCNSHKHTRQGTNKHTLQLKFQENLTIFFGKYMNAFNNAQQLNATIFICKREHPRPQDVPKPFSELAVLILLNDIGFTPSNDMLIYSVSGHDYFTTRY